MGMEPLLTAARWAGLASSALTVVLGIVHLTHQEASIDWPSKIGMGFIDDVQALHWRSSFFTLNPDTFLDVWGPVIMGVIGLVCHSIHFQTLQKVTSNFGFYFSFLMIQGLFGNIGYSGGMGILVSAVSFLAALLALIAVFADRSADAGLHLAHGMKAADLGM
ncbi:putative transmembrane protein [Gregarina niphandrodes]|uniref:Transmembrane protein n=1 Tax=Gregarina niphandrodes TaxID=110365 RepID=A0A023B1C4_GRENI|nr:putative transmembrane protein [Gregarina niphandrodes]EZG46749.1 putative transmembrane protein [Gregarina niphandrodes]|eukprot:XP_011132258.1 putative transmembrane protein [Gregarina niphandrodes]